MPAIRSHLTIAITAAIVLVGCSSTAEAENPSSEAAPGVEVTNCGFTETFEEPPSSVVTIKSSTTEALIALGLEDVIVGTAFQDGPLPDLGPAAALDQLRVASFEACRDGRDDDVLTELTALRRGLP